MIGRQALVEIVKDVSTPIAHNFGLPLVYESKEGRSFAGSAVTAIDRDIQAKLMEVLPGDFLGEETGGRMTGAKRVWYVDPLDGTAARIRGLPTSTCIVTLMELDGNFGFPILTVIHNPITDQTWSAEVDGGTWYQFGRNAKIQCKIDASEPVPETVFSIVTLWPGEDYYFDEVKKEVLRDKRFNNQDFGGLGAAHASVVSGTNHLSACRATKAFETAAATLLMREAGGCAWSLNKTPFLETGFPLEFVNGTQTFTIPDGAVIARSEAIAETFLELVRKVNA